MRIIIDLGARYLKTIIVTPEKQVLSWALSLSEGITNGLITDYHRLLESIYSSIREAKDKLDVPLVNTEQDEIFLTTSLRHCSLLETTKNMENHNLVLSESEEIKLLNVWRDTYSLGKIEVNDLVPQLVNRMKHNYIAIFIDDATYNILKQLCQQNNSNLQGIAFSNCTPITNKHTIRIDVGYCSTRVFCTKSIHIIELGLEDLAHRIARKCSIPMREAERMFQLTDEYNASHLSVIITPLCKEFFIDLFTTIINVAKLEANLNLSIELQGGINYIPYISDFVEEKFGIPTSSLTSHLFPGDYNFINCEYILSNIN